MGHLDHGVSRRRVSTHSTTQSTRTALLLTQYLRSPSQVQERLDRLIGKIKKIQEPFMNGGTAPDILICAHGHILRAFTKRWLVSGTQDHLLKPDMELTISFYRSGTWHSLSL